MADQPLTQPILLATEGHVFYPPIFVAQTAPPSITRSGLAGPFRPSASSKVSNGN